jgi:hypothetical protein
VFRRHVSYVDITNCTILCRSGAWLVPTRVETIPVNPRTCLVRLLPVINTQLLYHNTNHIFLSYVCPLFVIDFHVQTPMDDLFTRTFYLIRVSMVLISQWIPQSILWLLYLFSKTSASWTCRGHSEESWEWIVHVTSTVLCVGFWLHFWNHSSGEIVAIDWRVSWSLFHSPPTLLFGTHLCLPIQFSYCVGGFDVILHFIIPKFAGL